MPQFSKPRARHSSKELGRRLLRRAALSVLAVVLFVVSGAGFAWHNIQSRVAWFNVDSILSEDDRPGTKPPDSYDGRAVNLLVLGTDSRSGDNNVDGSEGSDEVSVARSDTALVMHISADRKRVDAVSIPRDTLVDIPECKSLDGETTGAEEDGQFNSAFANGAGTGNDKKAVASGATCTLKTVEKMTGIRIDDFVVVDFNGLSKVVDSLGGVNVHVDEAIDDSDYTGLTLDEGCQKLDGQTALQYARVRHGVGDGSDISRISRQQKLMNAMASKALSSNVLTKSGFLTSTLETLTTSEHIGQIGNLSGLASSIQGRTRRRTTRTGWSPARTPRRSGPPSRRTSPSRPRPQHRRRRMRTPPRTTRPLRRKGPPSPLRRRRPRRRRRRRRLRRRAPPLSSPPRSQAPRRAPPEAGS